MHTPCGKNHDDTVPPKAVSFLPYVDSPTSILTHILKCVHEVTVAPGTPCYLYVSPYHDTNDVPVANERFDWSFNDADLCVDSWKVMMYSDILGEFSCMV
ncbi:hypothetical protein JB92DRAFT_2926312 [Gautieria morchelliformis]|nr:hypothetical protein JB92DRAFT_2926312 [Gautieria morchelliformis]